MTIFDTLHALGLKSESGVEMLIHVGLETVDLNGAPFKAHVKSGDKIIKGQLLLEFDMDAIRAAGCPTITPVLVTNEDEVGSVVVRDGMIIVGVPYTEPGLLEMGEISGGTPYGASTIAANDGSRQPSKNELAIARFQGRHVARITGELVRGRGGL